MVGPNFQTPQTPEVTQWVSANQLIADTGSGMTSRSAPVANWWQTFRDPVLDQLVEDAYSQNLSLQIAGARVFQARAQLGIATGELYPQQQRVGAGVTYRKVSENLQFVSDIERFIDLDTNFTTSQVGFDAAWEIDVWGGLRRNVESATANLTAQIADYDDVLVSLTGDVAAAYINVRALEAAIGITRENVALQEESLRLAEVRFNNGVTTELDVEQAKTILNETRAVVPSLQSDLQQSRNALSVLLAEPPGKISDRLKRGGGIPVARNQVGVGIPAQLLRRRPDIRAAEMEAAAQSAQIGVAINALYPQFQLGGTIGWQASSGRTLFSPQSFAGSFTPGIGWNVLNYGRLENNVRAQDAEYEALVANYQNTVLAAYAETANAMFAYKSAKEQLGFLNESAISAGRAAEIAVAQYVDGLASYQRVIDTQRALLAVQAKEVEAQSAVSENLVSVYKALGGGWQIRQGREFLPDEKLAEMAHRTDWGDLLKKSSATQTQ